MKLTEEQINQLLQECQHHICIISEYFSENARTADEVDFLRYDPVETGVQAGNESHFYWDMIVDGQGLTRYWLCPFCHDTMLKFSGPFLIREAVHLERG